MKLITAVIQPTRLDAVKDALTALGIKGLTASEAHGYGAQRGQVEVYRAQEIRTDFVSKTRLEILVREEDAKAVVEAVVSAAHTGNIGDGKIWTSTVDDVIRVRTGERGPSAV